MATISIWEYCLNSHSFSSLQAALLSSPTKLGNLEHENLYSFAENSMEIYHICVPLISLMFNTFSKCLFVVVVRFALIFLHEHFSLYNTLQMCIFLIAGRVFVCFLFRFSFTFLGISYDWVGSILLHPLPATTLILDPNNKSKVFVHLKTQQRRSHILSTLRSVFVG